MLSRSKSLTLLLLGVLVPSTVCAQDPDYDLKSETTVTGTVADVKGGRSALYWFSRIHTLGLGHMRAPEKRLLLRTDTEMVEIQLGPSVFLTNQKVEISDGDTLEVIGSRVTIGESQVVLARQLRKGDDTWALRDAAGQPLWNAGATERRGFWTTKKVLLTVVVIKVIALATVLRH
jgi:hypothetical protein